MATWVTHLMIADAVLEQCPELDRRGFCVGNIAPDCNVENEDWTAFTPSREVTHWMQSSRKEASDCDVFLRDYLWKQKVVSKEHYSFLLGYYSHLIADAEFQRMIRDSKRVEDVWMRIKADSELREKSKGYPEDWDSAKILISKKERKKDIDTIEAEYLEENPRSGFLTEIINLKEFPDYIDYLPHGAIVRKIGAMGYVPQKEPARFIGISREEYQEYVKNTIEIVVRKLREARRNIKVIGDSLAAGAGCSTAFQTDELIFEDDGTKFCRIEAPNSWWGLLDTYLQKKDASYTVKNRGCGGAYSYQIDRYLDVLVEETDKLILLLVGCNDRKRAHGMDELRSNVSSIIDRLHSMGKMVIVMTPTPSLPANEYYPNRIYHTDEVVKILKEVAAQKNVQVVDNYKYTLDYLDMNQISLEELICAEGCKNDGLHPADPLQKLVFENIINTFEG